MQSQFSEKIHLGEGETGVFFPLFSGKGPDCVAALSGLFFVGAFQQLKIGCERGKRTNGKKTRKKLGKFLQNSGKVSRRTQAWDKNGRTSPDREAPVGNFPVYRLLILRATPSATSGIGGSPHFKEDSVPCPSPNSWSVFQPWTG